MAELDSPPQYKQLADEKVARKLFPLCKRRDSQPWTGARPAPDKEGLWLAQMMDGEQPAVDMTPFRVDRF